MARKKLKSCTQRDNLRRCESVPAVGFFLNQGKQPGLSVRLVILLFTYKLHKHSYSFPAARIERCVSVCFSFFSPSRSWSEAEPLPTSPSYTHTPTHTRSTDKRVFLHSWWRSDSGKFLESAICHCDIQLILQFQLANRIKNLENVVQ